MGKMMVEKMNIMIIFKPVVVVGEKMVLVPREFLIG